MLTPIRRLRQEHDVPQWVLAERASIRAPRLSMIELNRVVPSAAELERLAVALGVRSADLCAGGPAGAKEAIDAPLAARRPRNPRRRR